MSESKPKSEPFGQRLSATYSTPACMTALKPSFAIGASSDPKRVSG